VPPADGETAMFDVVAADPAARIARAKVGYSTRRVPRSHMLTVLTGDLTPRAGDLVLARVKGLGQHRRIELASGRQSYLFPGDEVVVCYGARYAPDQFESVVCDDLSACHLVAAGGLASRVRFAHRKMKMPTRIAPVGLVGDAQGRPINLRDFALEPVAPHPRVPTFVILGTSMNAGKTTAAAYLIRGLVNAGLRVAGGKVTGTAAGPDPWRMVDAGASPVLDFTDAGLASTYSVSAEELRRVFVTIVGHLAASGAEAIVLEVADGLLQAETAMLIEDRLFRTLVDGVIFAAPDALGAIEGVRRIQALRLPLLGVGGLLTRSPLAVQEARPRFDVPILDSAMLRDPGSARELWARAVKAARTGRAGRTGGRGRHGNGEARAAAP
jgi:hypothetical protein